MTIDMLLDRVAVLEKQMALLMPHESHDIYHSKPKKSYKESSDDDNSKKKRVSGYILFSKATREEVKTELAALKDSPKNTEIMCQLAKNCKALSDQARDDWNTKAKQLKEIDS